jgi:hypothetical protein
MATRQPKAHREANGGEKSKWICWHLAARFAGQEAGLLERFELILCSKAGQFMLKNCQHKASVPPFANRLIYHA